MEVTTFISSSPLSGIAVDARMDGSPNQSIEISLFSSQNRTKICGAPLLGTVCILSPTTYMHLAVPNAGTRRFSTIQASTHKNTCTITSLLVHVLLAVSQVNQAPPFPGWSGKR